MLVTQASSTQPGHPGQEFPFRMLKHALPMCCTAFLIVSEGEAILLVQHMLNVWMRGWEFQHSAPVRRVPVDA